MKNVFEISLSAETVFVRDIGLNFMKEHCNDPFWKDEKKKLRKKLKLNP
jgi:hypothetical protein